MCDDMLWPSHLRRRTPIPSHLFIQGVRQPIACRTYRSSDELNMSTDTTSLLKFSTSAAFAQVKTHATLS